MEERNAPLPRTMPLLSLSPQADFNGFRSVQVNVDSGGNNILNDAANEPSLTVASPGRRDISVGWRQFNNVQSNFRQGGYGYSGDGGATWTFPGVLEPGVFRSDPVLDRDRDNAFYYLSLKESFFDDLWSSLTKGAAWSRIDEATGGDKQWMTIDRTGGQGDGHIYQAWSTAGNNYGGRQFSRSTDGGVTWMSPIFLPNRPVWGTLDVAPNGDLYIVGEGDNDFWFLRSSDAKNAAVTPSFDRVVAVDLGGSMAFGQVVNPGGLSGQTWVACDKSVGTPTSGNIYMLCSVRRNNSNPCDVMFVRSTNGGQTWSTPRRINTDPTGQQRYHWFGTLAVAPNGRIDVVWYDSRADSTNTFSALYYASSYDGGITWTPNTQISAPFDSHLGWPNQSKLGDYIGVISDLGGANVVYAATFNGEQDVYYVRVPVPARYRLDAESVNITTGLPFSGNAQSLWFSDSSYLIVKPGIGTQNGPTASIQVDFTAPADAIHDLWISTDIHEEFVCPMEVALYNWELAHYDLVGQVNVQPLAGPITFALPRDPTPYVGAARKIRAQVKLVNTFGSRAYRTTFRYDLVRIEMN